MQQNARRKKESIKIASARLVTIVDCYAPIDYLNYNFFVYFIHTVIDVMLSSDTKKQNIYSYVNVH